VAVAHDTQTRFPTTDGTTGTNSVDTTTGDRSFTHAASVNAKGAVVAVFCTGTTAVVAGVTYGGVSMTLSADAQDTTEAGRIQVFTLTGSTFPPGSQSVVLQTATATAKWACCSTVTADGLTTVNDTTVLNTTVAANPTVTMNLTLDSMAYAGVHAGNAAPATTGIAGTTIQRSNDYGALSSNAARWTNVTAPTVAGTTIGVTLASDDHCVAAVAIAEAVGVLFPTTPVIETFTGANTTSPPNGNWSNDYLNRADGRGIQIQSNAATGVNAGGNEGWYNLRTFEASQEAYFTISTVGASGDYCGVALRIAAPGTAGMDGYEVDMVKAAGTDNVEFYRIDNSTYTQIGASVPQEFSNGDALGGRIVGSQLDCYRKPSGSPWAAVARITDATYTAAGYVGINSQGTTQRLDDYGAGAYNPPGVLMQPMIPA
jgi:hypothetical protein